ncbi:phytoene/squalene synthase family protein [Haloplanus salilacus]|uniref:phytoene/squalene synthase family protein n=1 Tax=Haloplanus salilacus TaxID=2949994 RepID=UPI0030D10E9E
MVTDDGVSQGKEIQRRTGTTFHFATRLLPTRIREATYVLYAFFRVADEVVDDAEGVPPDEQRRELERLRAAALGEEPRSSKSESEEPRSSANQSQSAADDPVLAAFAEMRDRHGIDDADVHAFVDAMLTDVTKERYESYEELRAYMDGSAAAVGRMMTAVMDPEAYEEALPHATALGEAFQLTNFLRDVGEDAVERDRIYLPATTLEEYGVDPEAILDLEYSEAFADAMRHEMQRTEGLYQDGVAGIQYLPEDCQFAVTLAAVLYADHHRLIREREFDVLSATPELSTGRKVSLLVRTALNWAVLRDPEAVFYRVGAVPASAPTGTGPEAETSLLDWLPTR